MARRPKFRHQYNTNSRLGRWRYQHDERRAFRYHSQRPLVGDDDNYRYHVTMLLPIGAVIADMDGVRWVHLSEKWWLSEHGTEAKGYMLSTPMIVVGMSADVNGTNPTITR